MREEVENVVVCEKYTIYLERGHHPLGIGIECHACGAWMRSIRYAWGHAETVCGYKLKKRVNKKGIRMMRKRAA